MSFSIFAAFFITSMAASLIPGPSMILALTHGLRFGKRKSIFSALGNTTASVLQASLSAAGLGAVLINSYNLFLIIKVIGGLYLIYIGITMLRSEELPGIEAGGDDITNKSGKDLFYQGFIVAAANPKAIIFFSALFPQFISPQSHGTHQLIIMVITIAFIAFFAFMTYSIAGEKILKIISYSGIKKYFLKISGSAFILSGFGILAECRK